MHAAFKRIYVQNTGNFSEDGSSDLTTVPDKTVHLVNYGPSTTADTKVGDAIDIAAENTDTNDITAFDNIRLLFRDGDYIDQSPVIPVSELEVSDLTYTDPQQQQTDVDIPTPSSDGFWTIKITNVESGNQPFERRSFEIEVLSGDTASNVSQKFADAINQAEDQINDYKGASVTANNASGVLELTANDTGDIFDVATRNFEPNSISTPTNPTSGTGTYEQVHRYEQDDDGTVGRYVESTNLLGSLPGPAKYANKNGNYDLLTFTFHGDSDNTVNKSIARQTYIVALESAVITNSTGFDTFLDPVTVATDR